MMYYPVCRDKKLKQTKHPLIVSTIKLLHACNDELTTRCSGDGDLLGEPTVTTGAPLVRLTDLEPRLQTAWQQLLTFARDPKALHELLKLQWGLWEKYGLGISKVSGWRDGIASNTGFPGTHGFLRSANGPQEAQMRGMLHRHTFFQANLFD